MCYRAGFQVGGDWPQEGGDMERQGALGRREAAINPEIITSS